MISFDAFSWRPHGRIQATLPPLTLEVPAGQRVLLLGPSGAGKSTLLAAIAGMLGPESGEQRGTASVAGAPALEQRAGVGLVLQDPETQTVFARVGEEVAFGAENLGVPRHEIPARVTAALAAVGLEVQLERSTSALSGGQKQRLALATALAMQPEVLLLDEPTASLDPAGALEVRDSVAQLLGDRSLTIVIVEHRIDLWQELIDRVIVLGARGELIADGSPGQVFDDAATRAALRAAGVWLPGDYAASGFEPVSMAREATDTDLPAQLSALELGVQRDGRLVATQLNFAVHPGEILALRGPNGSGKSTLALTLGGLLAPAVGDLLSEVSLGVPRPRRWQKRRDPLDARRPIAWPSAELAQRIASVFQHPETQFVTSSVRAEVSLAGANAERVAELLERLGLAALAEAHPLSLSGGEKRRLSVATALASPAPVIVLDEPTFGQDARTWYSLIGLLAEAQNQGRSVVLATHDDAAVRALGARELNLAVEHVR